MTEVETEMSTEMPRKPKVLLVDDNPSDIKLAQFAAKKTKWIEDLRTFLDSSEALDFLRAQKDWRPHLIVIDLNMPKLNGFELLLLVQRGPESDGRVRLEKSKCQTTSRSWRWKITKPTANF
mgnify:CR=1 FL=1